MRVRAWLPRSALEAGCYAVAALLVLLVAADVVAPCCCPRANWGDSRAEQLLRGLWLLLTAGAILTIMWTRNPPHILDHFPPPPPPSPAPPPMRLPEHSLRHELGQILHGDFRQPEPHTAAEEREIAAEELELSALFGGALLVLLLVVGLFSKVACGCLHVVVRPRDDLERGPPRSRREWLETIRESSSDEEHEDHRRQPKPPIKSLLRVAPEVDDGRTPKSARHLAWDEGSIVHLGVKDESTARPI